MSSLLIIVGKEHSCHQSVDQTRVFIDMEAFERAAIKGRFRGSHRSLGRIGRRLSLGLLVEFFGHVRLRVLCSRSLRGGLVLGFQGFSH